jgi:hypothetical protein
MDGDVVRVHLEALGFTDASATATRVITIPKGNINVGPINNTSNNVTFTLYASDPGDSANPADVIGSFTAKSKKTNPNDIEISKELYNKIVANGGNVYVRFTTRSGWFNTNYYVAEAKLDDLLNKVVTLNFKEI